MSGESQRLAHSVSVGFPELDLVNFPLFSSATVSVPSLLFEVSSSSSLGMDSGCITPCPPHAVSICSLTLSHAFSLSSLVYVLFLSQPFLCALSRDLLGTKNGGDSPFHPPSSPHCSTLSPLPQVLGETYILRWAVGKQFVQCCLLIRGYAGRSINVPKRH